MNTTAASDHSGYYTADLTALPFPQLWRQLPMPVVLKPLAMIGFWFYRLRWGNRPAVGYPWPETLNMIPADQVPSEVLEKFTPFFRSCIDAEFTLQFVFVCSGIGQGATTIYSAVLLDKTGLVSAVTVCEYGASDVAVISQGSYSFQTALTDGSLLLTTPATADALAINLDPPHWKIVGLPLASEVPEVLRAHRDRLSDVSQRPVRFDSQSVKNFILSETQSYIDHSFAQGRYRWLSNAECDELKKTSEAGA